MDEQKGSASPSRRRANRLNALRSTGPRTETGKERASRNSTRHGLLSEKFAVISGEDPTEFERFRQDFITDLAPEGELEDCLVARIIECFWRLRRIGRMESLLFAYHTLDRRATSARSRASSLQTIPTFEFDLRKPSPEDEAAYRDANKQAWEAEAELDNVPLVPAFLRDSAGPAAFDKLSRYETRIERSLYRALHELQRRQASRRGEPVLSPAVVDVDLSLGK